ncbi:MAG TPA: VWA domain-containing protein [Chthoniobacterales bacterium]|jgi:Ca-activated chloride channel family protein
MKPLELGEGFAILQPLFLLLLLLIPVLAWLRGKRGGSAAVVYSSTNLVRSLGKMRKSRAGAFLATLTYLGLASLIVALARPQWGTSRTEMEASGIDIMLAIDVSRSMLAEDFTIGMKRANRLEAVKQVTEKFINGRPNDRIGIVAFSGRPYLVSPPTLDHGWLTQNLERIRIGMVEDGTAIGSAIASTANRFKNKDAKSRLIVLLTDGDNNAGRVSPITAAEAAGALGIKIYTIGAGTNGVVPFPMRDGFGNITYARVMMKFEEAALKKIAEISKGEYFRATDTQSLQGVFDKIDQLEKTTIETKLYRNYRDLFPWFLGAGFVLLLVPFLLEQTIWRRSP